MSKKRDLVENPSAPDGEEQEKLTPGQELYQTLQFLVCIVLFVIFLFTFVVRITVVDGESMENTLFNGDIVLVRSIGYEPAQGDVVVLTKETFEPQSIIKRVIATGGQTVDVDYAAGAVCVDGVPLDEPYIKEAMRVPWWGEGVNHVTVPEGSIFVMGDNRNNSSDSRAPEIGIVDGRCVIGHAVAVLFPFSDLGSL